MWPSGKVLGSIPNTAKEEEGKELGKEVEENEEEEAEEEGKKRLKFRAPGGDNFFSPPAMAGTGPGRQDPLRLRHYGVVVPGRWGTDREADRGLQADSANC